MSAVVSTLPLAVTVPSWVVMLFLLALAGVAVYGLYLAYIAFQEPTELFVWFFIAWGLASLGVWAIRPDASKVAYGWAAAAAMVVTVLWLGQAQLIERRARKSRSASEARRAMWFH